MSKKVTIYSLVHCPYCVRAKRLLEDNGIDYTEFIAEKMPKEEVDALLTKTQMRTFPQIFIGEKLVGGFTELYELHQKFDVKTQV